MPGEERFQAAVCKHSANRTLGVCPETSFSINEKEAKLGIIFTLFSLRHAGFEVPKTA